MKGTYECLEEVTLEDVDDSLNGVPQLSVLGAVEFRAVFLQQQQSPLSIWGMSVKRFMSTIFKFQSMQEVPHLPKTEKTKYKPKKTHNFVDSSSLKSD